MQELHNIVMQGRTPFGPTSPVRLRCRRWGGGQQEPVMQGLSPAYAGDRHREKRLPVPPASKPDGRISRIRLSSRWFYLEEE